MRFLFSDMLIKDFLESFGVEDPQQWIERFRDDFEEVVDNNQIVKCVLSINPNKLERLTNDWGYSEKLTEKAGLEPSKDNIMRVKIVAFIIYNDAYRFEVYHKLWSGEKDLYQRFTSVLIGDNELIFNFEELDV